MEQNYFQIGPIELTRPEPVAVEYDGVPVFEVDRILDHRKIGRTKRIQYLILWKGYPLCEATWEPIENLDGALELVTEYNKKKNIQSELGVMTVTSAISTVSVAAAAGEKKSTGQQGLGWPTQGEPARRRRLTAAAGHTGAPGPYSLGLYRPTPHIGTICNRGSPVRRAPAPSFGRFGDGPHKRGDAYRVVEDVGKFWVSEDPLQLVQQGRARHQYQPARQQSVDDRRGRA